MSQTNDPGPSLPRRGRLITLEGGEGVGKSTQIGHLLRRLRDEGIEAVATREPGGSEGAEILRRVLLSGVVKPLGPAAEAILFAAARIDHIDALIEPALAAGIWVVSDRFADSTRAYQGGAGSLDMRLINALERTALGDLQPDLTLILDLPPGEGLRRAGARRKDADSVDRFEGEDLRFHEAIRAAFLTIAADNPQRCVVVDASASEAEVAVTIWTAVSDRFLKERELDRAHGS